MKKFILLAILSAVTALVAFADSEFITAFKTCSPFTDSGAVDTEGMHVESTKKIIGWEDNKCSYRETVNFSGINSTTACKFTKPQIDEIVSVMQAYEIVQKYTKESIDTSNLAATQNNPVVKVWQKYLQDPSVCTISGLK